MSVDRSRLLLGDAIWSPGTGLLYPAGGAAAALDSHGDAIELGSAQELKRQYPHLPRDEGAGLLIPGLVDCHAHFECAVLADQVPGGVGMARWVARLLEVRATYDRKQTEAAALEAAKGMRALGTVAVGDICTILATAPILAEADLLGVSLLEIFAANDEEAVAALKDARERMEAFPATDRIDVRVVPHSPYGSPPLTIRLLSAGGSKGSFGGGAGRPGILSDAPSELELPGVYAAGMALEGRAPSAPEGEWSSGHTGVRSIHAAEHADEVDWLVAGTGGFAPVLRSRGVQPPGETPVRYLDSLRAIGEESLLVHMVKATPDELALVRKRGATVVLCPRSNLHIGGELADLPAIRAAGIPYVLGTDSLASTPDHDLLGEVRTLLEAFPEVPVGELLAAATTGGAAALGLRHHPWVRIDRRRIPELFEGRAH